MMLPSLSFHVSELEKDIDLDPFIVDKKDPIGVFGLRAKIPSTMEYLMETCSNELNPFVKVIFSDGSYKPMYFKHLILNIAIWRIFSALKLPILQSDIQSFKEINERTISNIQTKVLPKCLTVKAVDKRKVFGLFHESICVLFNFIHCYLWEYASGISLSELYEIYDFPEVEDICDVSNLNPYDTKTVEITIEHKKKQFVDLIKDKHKDSCIGPYLLTDTLNLNQIAQLFIAYGPRSDINDIIVGKAILSSTLKGLNGIDELAIEALASKKSSIYNRSSVGTASYNNRQGLLTACEIYHAIDRPCENDETLRMFISKGSRFVGKTIIEHGIEIKLTEENIKQYEGKFVDMISVVHCRYSNGVCSRCMGEMFNFFINTLHLGLAAGSEIFSVILQLILSSKHLVKTDTIDFYLDEIAKKWLFRHNNNFQFKYFDPKFKLGIPTSAIGEFKNITDLNKIKETGFSKIDTILILDEDNKVVEVLNLAVDPVYPYLTKSFISYLMSVKNEIGISDHMYIIPLDKWDFDASFIGIMNITFDMTSYVSSVWNFMKDSLKNYTDVSEALNKFADIIYKKSDANIMLVEIILRSLMIASPTDYSFPNRKSGDPIYFGTLLKVIANRSLTPKLIFEKLKTTSMTQKFFLQLPSTYTKPNSAGMFAPFWGY